MKQKSYDTDTLKAIRKSWYSLPPEAVPESKREIYCLRKKAVDMYIDDARTEDIYKATGIQTGHISEYLRKCLIMDENGKYYVYYALIPHCRCVPKNISKKKGNFSALLDKYPELPEFIQGNYFGDRKYTLEKNMNYRTLHEKFIQKCKNLGVQDYEYPLNTRNLGYVSLISYVKELENKNIEKAAARQSKNSRQKLLSTGIGQKYTTNSVLPYQTVQIDGHIIDLGYCVDVDNQDGTISQVMATRPWLIAIIDVSTRCILGYSLTQSFNYGQTDVLSAIRNALEPHQQMDFSISGLKYSPNGGYPSLMDPRLKYALFDTVMMDNAKSHLSENVIHKLVDVLGCSLDFGAVSTPETRGIIERFFGTLEHRGFHRLPGTTGSGIQDVKRKDPQKEAIKYNITFEQIRELIEILIAEYNNTPHSSLKNETPLECLSRKMLNPFSRPTVASEELQKEIHHLTYISKKVTVRGGISSGKRPYIQFQGARYRNNLLAVSNEYVGKDITILIDPDDISSVEAYNSNGFPLGTLTANGEYGRIPHSLKTRKNAVRLTRQNGTQNSEYSAALTAYEDHLKKESRKTRRAATKADILKKEKEIQKNPSSEQDESIQTDIHNDVPNPSKNISDSNNKDRDYPTDPIEFYLKYLKK